MQIPKDLIGNGCGFRGWVYCTFYGATSEEVENKSKKYFREYPPEGYDTHAYKVTKHKDGYYYVKTIRWSTCD